jgi:hypothetical protein
MVNTIETIKHPISRLILKNSIAIFLVNLLASVLYWYYSIWWFDMPMHFWGGAWVLFMLIYIKYLFFKKDFSVNIVDTIKNYYFIFFMVLVVCVGWEVFEYIVNEYTNALIMSPLDSISDIFFGVSGALFAWLFLLKKKYIALVS